MREAAGSPILKSNVAEWTAIAFSTAASPHQAMKALHLVEELRAHYGRVSLLGQTDAAGLALAGRAATALLNPGRIGLVAVDALALQLPVLSTRYEFHAPEAEYLEEGKTVFYSENTVQDFARLWRQALAGDITFTSSSWIPSIEHSAGVIAQAIMDTLDEKALTR